MPFGESQFEKPSMPSIEKPEKVEEKTPEQKLEILEKGPERSAPEILKEKAEIAKKELEKVMEEHKQFSLFERVKNKVIFVNEKANIPPELKEKLELGKESSLGLFLKTAEPIRAKELGERNLETWPREHGRSAILERTTIHDKGHSYRDIDLKGIGSTVPVIETGTRREGHWGLLEKKDALHEYAMSENFLKAGIRTLRVLGIIELEEILLKGKKVSLKEAKEKGIIKGKFQPVIEVRAFGTKTRIRDFIRGFEGEIKKLLLEDAKKIVSQEIGRDFSNDRDYLEWFTNTFGRNLGLMHKNGWYHGRLGPHESSLGAHNITLDCRITDFDTVRKIKFFEEKRLNNEKNLAISSCLRFAHELGIFEDAEMRKKFEEGYNAVFPPKKERKSKKA